MQGYVTLHTEEIVARRSGHDVNEYASLAVEVLYGGDGTEPHFRIMISAEEARALASELWAAAATADFEARVDVAGVVPA